MQKFVTKRWVSAVSTAKLDFTQSKLYKGNEAEFRTTFRKAEQKFNGNVPEGLRMLTYDPTCNAVQTAVWFEGNTMRTTAWSMQTLRGCQIDVEKQSEEFQTFMKQSDIYFNAAGDRAYLKRADGKVSEWIIATN